MKRRSKIILGLCSLLAVGYWAYSIGKVNHFSERNFSDSIGKNGIVQTVALPPLAVALDSVVGFFAGNGKRSPDLERVVDVGVSEPVYSVREDSTVEYKPVVESAKIDDRIIEGAMAALGKRNLSDDGVIPDAQRAAEDVRPLEVKPVVEERPRQEVEQEVQYRRDVPKGAVILREYDVRDSNGILKEHVTVVGMPDPFTLDQCFAKIDPYLRGLPNRRFEHFGVDRCNETVARAFFKDVPGIEVDVSEKYVKDCARFLCQPAYYKVTQEGDKTVIEPSWR